MYNREREGRYLCRCICIYVNCVLLSAGDGSIGKGIRNRTEPAEPNRTEPNRTEPNRTEPNR